MNTLNEQQYDNEPARLTMEQAIELVNGTIPVVSYIRGERQEDDMSSAEWLLKVLN